MSQDSQDKKNGSVDSTEPLDADDNGPIKLLKFTQEKGFEVIDSPFEWPPGGSFSDYLQMGGYGGEPGCEESEGAFGYEDGIRHWYNDKNGTRFTVIDGSCRSEHIFTTNSADHMALRVALAPLAHVRLAVALAEIRKDHGTLKHYDEHERREYARERRERRQGST